MSGNTSTSGRFEITAGPQAAGNRVDRFLADAIGTLSRSRVKTLIAEGHLRCGEQALRDPDAAVRPGSIYTLDLPPPLPVAVTPQAMPLSILYEDVDLLVLDKPPGLVVHPAPGNQDRTLVNALLAYCGDNLPGIGGERRPGIVHRLDKDTSGVMVVAKTAEALARLSQAFAAREIRRAYLALCWGVPSPLEGEIAGAIGRDPRDRKRMAVLSRGGKSALTRYRALAARNGAVALLRCELATGRTHQIRVHLAKAGHPLVGDPTYLRRIPAAAKELSGALRARLLDFPRQALHAAELGFAHPRTGTALSFKTPPPEDMAGLLAMLYAQT
jgi:23S rRNA pseudouridine1911/1915/1917 synthase